MIIAINTGEGEKEVRQFAEKYGWDFQVLLDRDYKVASLYRVNSHPVNFIIGRSGELMGITIGYRDWDTELAYKLINTLVENSK